MRRAAIAIGILAGLANPASAATYAASSPEAQNWMKAYFGNTLICTAAGIFECHNWMKADGTLVLFSWDSRPNIMVEGVPMQGVHGLEGTWWLEGEPGKFQLCRKNGPTAKPLCQDEPQRKLGDEWDHPGSANWPAEHFQLVAGHR